MEVKEIDFWVEASITTVVCEVLSSDNIFSFVRMWCINILKIWENKFVFLILYVDDILLENSLVSLLKETKRLKDLGDASSVHGT